jgi:coenzyme Q-binding protein COQ10
MASAEKKVILPISLVDLFKVITDYESYPQFVTGMKKAQVLSSDKSGQGTKKVSFELEMIKRVQYTVNISENLESDSSKARVEWNLDVSEFLKVSHGVWILQSLGPNSTEVTYKLDVEFKFSVPSFLLKGLVANSLPTAISEFSQRAKSLSTRKS